MLSELLEPAARIFGITVVRYFLIAGIPFLIFYVLLNSRLSNSRIQARSASKADLIREISNSMVTSLVFAILAVGILYTPLKEYTLIYKELGSYPVWWIPVSLVLSLVFHDTYFYWMHRALHHKAIFRYTHLLHHKSTSPSPFASYSFHFFEAIAEGFVLVVLAFILPMHPLTIILFIVVGLIINVYGHLGYEIAPRWLRNNFLFEVINTSVYHNLHHGKFKENYGLYFRWWDRLCKTENPDYVKEYDRIQEQRFGSRVKEATRPPLEHSTAEQ